LPAIIAIKHQIRMLMAQDEFKKAESKFVEQSVQRAARDATLSLPALGRKRIITTLESRSHPESRH
ncbi:MAG TPA: hypothetical protein VK877_12180, partial [Pseudolabrys sp.]|nr:hypothetical protein [Pseudolabrys sp.]